MRKSNLNNIILHVKPTHKNVTENTSSQFRKIVRTDNRLPLIFNVVVTGNWLLTNNFM